MATEGEGGSEGGAGGAADLLGGAAAAGGGADAGAGGEHGGGDGAGAGGEHGGGDAAWLEHFSASKDGDGSSPRDWLKSKGFKTIDDVVKGYREAETTIRNKGLVGIKVPGEGAKPEEISAYHKAIGVPEDAKGYEIKPPTGADGKPIALNQPLIDRLSDAAAKSGVPKGAFEATVGEYIKAQLDEVAAGNAKEDAAAQDWIKQQGATGTAKLAAIDAAARMLQFSRDDMASLRGAFGSARALTIMARLGEGMAEDTLVGGDGKRFGISGAEAQKEIDQLKTDRDFQTKVRIPGSPEKVRWERLNAAVAAARDRAQKAA